jgi:hypothetical protein
MLLINLEASLYNVVTKGCGLAIYIKKYLKAKEELWKLKFISPCKKTIPNLLKNPLQETKILQVIL